MEEAESDELNLDDLTEYGCEGLPEVGMAFKTHHDVSKFYKAYAQRVGFGVSVRRSSFTKDGLCLYLELMCCKGGGSKRAEPKFRKRTSATTNCLARIRVKLWADRLLHLELANLDHNHPVSPSMARFLSSNRHLSGFGRKRGRDDDLDDVHIGEEETQATGNGLGVLEELLFGESNSRSLAKRGRLKFGEGDSEAIRLFLTRMQAKNSNFFNVIDLDDEGCARSVFWADARSRASYQYFNDVVCLDTTYVSNKYDLPLATFVGANHHGHSVLLGCALLSDEMIETYQWLLKAWIACMAGNIPKAMITNHCKSIMIAVSETLPGVRHRVCLGQIMKKASEKLGGLTEFKAILKAMQKAVYDSLTVEEFEMEWMKMIELYGLCENDWMISLHECRNSWVPVYLKDTFWAGMSTTQKNDSSCAFFDGFVDTKTSLRQFIGKYELALQSKYEKEAQADFETFHKRRPSVSKFYMEEQLSIVYTMDMFKKFQDEIEAIMYCHASVRKVEGTTAIFDVKECIFLEDGKRTMNRTHEVLYDSEDKNFHCICGLFQFTGILCRHALSVFKLEQVHEIPSQYILDRWKKDYKRLHALNMFSEDVVANNRIGRYDYLSMRCLQLVEVGMLSDKYKLALKLIREAEKFLLSDCTHERTQPKIIDSVNKLSKPEYVVNTAPVGKGIKARRRHGFPTQKLHEQVSSNALPIGSQPPLQLPGQFADNHAVIRPSIVYMFPGGFNPHAFGNGAMMPWMYHQMCQPKDPSDMGQAPRKRRVSHGLKATQGDEKPHRRPPVRPPVP